MVWSRVRVWGADLTWGMKLDFGGVYAVLLLSGEERGWIIGVVCDGGIDGQGLWLRALHCAYKSDAPLL